MPLAPFANPTRLPDLAALSRTCRSYCRIIENEMQKEALADGMGFIRACEQKNLLLARHLPSPTINDYLEKHPKTSLRLPNSLHLAIFQPPNGEGCLPGCEEVLQVLIERFIDVNVQDKCGRTALHQAIQECASLHHIEILLNASANPNVQDRCGNTSLHLAASTLNQKVANLPLEQGAGFNPPNLTRDTPLHALARPSIVDLAIMNSFLECIKALLKHGADPNIRNAINETPLNRVVRIPQIEAVEAVEELLNSGANPNAVSVHGTATHIAARLGHLSILKLLVAFNADINTSDIRAYTPLHYAVEFDHLSIVELLLEHNANLEAHDGRDRIPLHHATEHGRPSILQLLLNHTVDIDARNDEDSTALHLASWPNKSSLVCVKLLLEKGADPNVYNGYGETALHLAVSQRPQDPWYHASVEIANELILSGADPNLPAVGIPGYDGGIPQLCTAFHVAAGSGNVATVKLLLRNGGDPSARDFAERTPLHMAERRGTRSQEWLECAKLLRGKSPTP